MSNKNSISKMNYVLNSKLKFSNPGLFLLKFLLLDEHTQKELSDNLVMMLKNPQLNDGYIIHDFYKVGDPLRSAELVPPGMNIILIHSFVCNICGNKYENETNSFNGYIETVCSMCMYDN